LEKFPFILATDVAGTVEQIGDHLEGDPKFQVGDRVWSWTPSLSRMDPRFGGFQNYCIVNAAGTAKIPSNLSFEEGAALALPAATAVAGLYAYNSVPRPKSTARVAPTADSPVLYVSGGASAVGSSAVQLGALAGLRVIATASPKVKAVIPAGQKVQWAYDAISEPATLKATVAVLGGQGALVSVLGAPPADIDLTGIKVDGIFASAVYKNPELVKWWVQFISDACEAGTYVPLKPEIIGTSVDDAQKILDHHASGQVSASKPVLKLA